MESHASVQQLLEVFDKFTNLYESDIWLEAVSLEDVKTSFKLGAVVEDSVKHLKKKGCLEHFMSVLSIWRKSRSRTEMYNSQIFDLACDSLLTKFFTNKCVSTSSLQVAVRIYIAMFPNERFKQFLYNLIINRASLQTIINYMAFNKDKLNLSELYCKLLLRKLCTEENLQPHVLFLLDKPETSLTHLLNVLTKEAVHVRERQVQDIILKVILDKMSEKSSLSKQFWLSLIKDVNKNLIVKVCAHSKEFSQHLFDFIIYAGSMMTLTVKNSNLTWTNKPNFFLYPELTYTDLVGIIKSICKENREAKIYFLVKTSEAQLGNPRFWAELEKDI